MRASQTIYTRYWRELRALLTLSGPIMVAQLSTTGMSFVDISMAGQYSALDLSAIALGSSIWVPVYLLVRGTLMAITPTVAHLYGAQQLSEIGGQVRQGLWVALLLSLLSLTIIYHADGFLQLLQIEPLMVTKTMEYLKAVAFGLPAVCMFQALVCYCEGMGQTKPGMVLSFMALVLNIPLNYVFIYGKFGLPELGGVGCGYTTAICMWLMFLAMAVYTFYSHKHRVVCLYERWDFPKASIIASQLKLGLPIGLAIFGEASIFSVVALVIGKLGTIVVAGHQIALNVSGLAFMIPMSLSMGLTIRVGQALGAGKKEQAQFSSYVGIATTLITATFTAFVMLFLPEVVTSVYTQNPKVASLAGELLVYAALFQYADGIQVAANGALRGYKDTRIPMVLVIFACWGVALPLGYILGMTNWVVEPMGPHGLWIGLLTALTICATLLAARLHFIIKRSRGVLLQSLLLE